MAETVRVTSSMTMSLLDTGLCSARTSSLTSSAWPNPKGSPKQAHILYTFQPSKARPVYIGKKYTKDPRTTQPNLYNQAQTPTSTHHPLSPLHPPVPTSYPSKTPSLQPDNTPIPTSSPPHPPDHQTHSVVERIHNTL